MSTRCRIGIENKDGTITSIYCHYDGYPSYTGKILKENYSDEKILRELISYGDTSVIEPTLKLSKSTSYAEYGEDASIMESDLKKFIENKQEYGYLFRNGKWFVDYGKGLEELTDEIIENS